MNRIKMLALACGLCLSFAVMAQTETVPAPAAEEQMERRQGNSERRDAMKARAQEQRAELLEKLDLTAEQQTAFDAINEKFHTDFQLLREESNGDRSVMRAGMRNLREARQAQLSEILSPEQMAIYDETMKAKEGKARRRRPRG